jgi:hypothetical protein
MNDLENIKSGVCPFTGKPYDCGRCEEYSKLEFHKGPGVLHVGLCFDRYLADGKTGMRHLHNIVGGKDTCTIDECADFFWEMHRRGAEYIPFGECNNFCYRRGCMGHAAKDGSANNKQKKGTDK